MYSSETLNYSRFYELHDPLTSIPLRLSPEGYSDWLTKEQAIELFRGRLELDAPCVATLCYSRHQYAELVFDQKVVTWIGLHRRALEYFGGAPRRVVPDNLKAAVLMALVHDPVLGEAYRQMALYYVF